MTARPTTALVIMIALQLVHAIEEFVLEFWNAFPPMRAVYGTDTGLGVRVFACFHAVLIGFGLWCLREVRRGELGARAALCAWIVIQSVTLAVHIAWFVVDPRYQPGLATSPLFLAGIAIALVAWKQGNAEARTSRP